MAQPNMTCDSTWSSTGDSEMRCITPSVILLLATSLCSLTSGAGEQFIAICYHDVQDNIQHDRVADALTISTDELVAQFSWLREHGYQPVSLDDILAARKGGKQLPEKAVLLSFDDGYESVYTRVFPLLKLFHYPAIIAPVVSWIEQQGGNVLYGDKPVSRAAFLSWGQLREMADSGLVEIASHSNDLHHGILGNPQGNRQAAATTYAYLKKKQRYESTKEYRARITRDLRTSSNIIAQRTGHRPRSIVWPYGSYSQPAIEIAAQLGMPITFGLEVGLNSIYDLQAVRRILVMDSSHLADLVTSLLQADKPPPIRVAHVDLDYIYDPDPAQQERNLGHLLDRIKALQINTVYLQAFADPDGDGNADALYFPNRHLPVRADLFNRVAWQLYTRSGVNVYAWLPVLSFVLNKEDPAAEQLVKQETGQRTDRESGVADYRRLSPFSARAHRIVQEIYEDLAIHAHFQGLLFHDDAYLSDYEDASQTARRIYRQQWQLPASLSAIRSNPQLFSQWTQQKTATLVYWTQTLADRVRYYRPIVKTARNLYAEVLMNPAAQNWYSQSLQSFLSSYDYTALMAMPFMEKARRPEQWLKKLVSRVAAIPGALQHTVFELQSVDWRVQKPIGSTRLRKQMRLLQSLGVQNFGYYPDDAPQDYPLIEKIRPIISLSDYPYPAQ